MQQHLGVILVQRNRRKEELGVDSMRAFVAESSSAPVTHFEPAKLSIGHSGLPEPTQRP